jgi:hypothetical protein
LHSDGPAARSARDVGAVAYTVGPHIALDTAWAPAESPPGRRVIAHELAHAAQQRGARQPGERDPIHRRETPALEAEATRVAAGGDADVVPAARPDGEPPVLMRLTPEQFRQQLGATPDQKRAIDALFANPEFLKLWNYLAACPAGPTRDLGPVALKVTPGLSDGGVERFGGYGGRTLEINPTKAEHKANATELVDTITHELVHALDDVDQACEQAGASTSPLGAAGTFKHPAGRQRKDLRGKPEETELLKEFGPGASDPCGEFIDINKAAQQLILQIMRSNMRVSKVGKPTITFVNEALRQNPKALDEYRACSAPACAKAEAKEKQAAISSCNQQILDKYVSVPREGPDLKAPEPKRPVFGPLYKPRRDFNKELINSVDDL